MSADFAAMTDFLARLRELELAATPGAWVARFSASDYDGDDIIGQHDAHWIEDRRGEVVVEAPTPYDAALIVALRNEAIPALKAQAEEIERLRVFEWQLKTLALRVSQLAIETARTERAPLIATSIAGLLDNLADEAERLRAVLGKEAIDGK